MKNDNSIKKTARPWKTCIGVFLWLALGHDITHAADRPNILFAFADDWGCYAGAYAMVDGPGSPCDVVKTPNVDRVAREGVLFKNAFVTAPSCTPCRSSLLSGQYFYRTGMGAILSGAQWDSAIPSYPLLLKKAGYHIGETYKVWSPGTPRDAPYGAGKYAYEQAGNRFNGFSQHVTKRVGQGQSLAAAKEELYAMVRGNFDAFLADRKPDQPFCYWFGPTLVHRKWIQGSGKKLWGVDPDALRGKLPAFLPDVPEIREDFADYLGEVQAFDAGLGVLLQRLEAIGEMDNTLIVVSGDHGAPGFPRGKCNLYDFGVRVPLVVRLGPARGQRVIEDFINLMDLAPTFLEAGGVTPPEVMTGRSFFAAIRSDASGWVDPQRNWVITGRERHVSSAREGNLPYPQRALRTQDYLYIINFKPNRWPMGNPYHLEADQPPSYEALTQNTRVTYRDIDAGPTKAWLVTHGREPRWQKYYDYAFAKRPYEELYILAQDPDQINNVAELPQYGDIRRKLKAQLLAELKRTGDPRVTGDGSTFDKPPYAGK